MKPFYNWAQNIKFSPRNYSLISNELEIRELLRTSSQNSEKLRVVGSGHSFSGLIETSSTLVSLDAMQRVLFFDSKTRRVRVEAGIKLHRLSQELHELGLAQENMGDVDRQSLAGALSTGTHGTGLKLPLLAEQMQSFRLLTPSGELLDVDRDRDPERFFLLGISFGACGILSEIELNTQPAYRLRCEKSVESLENVLEGWQDSIRNHRHFEFFWFPLGKWALCKRSDITEELPNTNAFERFVEDVVVENTIFDLSNRLVRKHHEFAPAVSRALSYAARKIPNKPRVDWSSKVFVTQRLSRFVEMEYAVPIDRVAEVLRGIRDLVKSSNLPVLFPVEVRCVRGDSFALSPTQGEDSAFIAVHMFKGMDFLPYFEGVEKIFCEVGGRPHWGKWHSQSRKSLEKSYPRLKEFCAQRAEFDPNNILVNNHLRHLLLD